MGKIHKTVLIMDDKSRVKVTKNLAKLKLENERTKMEHMISSSTDLNVNKSVPVEITKSKISIQISGKIVTNHNADRKRTRATTIQSVANAASKICAQSKMEKCGSQKPDGNGTRA